jgi:hypothetical protein
MTTVALERDFMRLDLHVHVICTRMYVVVVVKMVEEPTEFGCRNVENRSPLGADFGCSGVAAS